MTRSIRPTPEKRAQLVARRLSWERYHDEDLRLLAAEIRAAEERACAEVIDALEELIGTQAWGPGVARVLAIARGEVASGRVAS